MPLDPRPDFTPDWPTCATRECRGIQISGDACLAHAPDDSYMLLPQLQAGSELDLRGTVLDAALCKKVLTYGKLWTGITCARFDWVLFPEDLTLTDFRFDGRLAFDLAWFRGRIMVEELTCGELTFDGARFEQRVHLLGIGAETVSLVDAWFMDTTFLEARADEVLISGARFGGPATLKFVAADVAAADVTCEAPSSISGGLTSGPMPRLLWLSGNLGEMRLSDIDLRSCSFDGAHGLDQLRMDGRVEFSTAPGWFRARRRMLADESRWRGWMQDPGDARPERLADTYRSLRKSFEDSKNESGAGDFYYGEMEMRRHSAETSKAEKTILWFYWLFSEYGQRATRALVALFVVIAVVTTLLTLWGQDFGMAARIAVGAVVFRADDTELTAAGEWTVLTARFLGPVLLALAVLAVRARVKR